MSYVAVAIAGAAVIGAGATMYASSQSSKASEKAAEASANAQREGLTTEWNMFQQQREDYAPWREAGTKSLTNLVNMVETGPGVFEPEKTPGYEFGFKNFIEKPYLSGQSAKGKRLSGETIKGLTKYANDYAETAYDNFLTRYYQRLTPYQSLAGLGQTALNQSTALGTQVGSNIAGIQSNIGQIQAQNFMNQGQIASQTGAGIAGVANNASNSFMNYLMLSKLGALNKGA